MDDLHQAVITHIKQNIIKLFGQKAQDSNRLDGKMHRPVPVYKTPTNLGQISSNSTYRVCHPMKTLGGQNGNSLFQDMSSTQEVIVVDPNDSCEGTPHEGAVPVQSSQTPASELCSGSPSTVPGIEDLTSLNQIEEVPELSEKTAPCKKQRWRKENDKMLFKALREYCAENNETIDGLQSRLKHDAKADSHFWGTIALHLKWKGPLSTLQQRFMKLWNKRSFSVREERFLNTLYSPAKSDAETDWDLIQYHFPGFSLSLIKDYWKKKQEIYELTHRCPKDVVKPSVNSECGGSLFSLCELDFPDVSNLPKSTLFHLKSQLSFKLSETEWRIAELLE